MNRAIRPLGAAFDFSLPPTPRLFIPRILWRLYDTAWEEKFAKELVNILGPAVKGGVLSKKE